MTEQRSRLEDLCELIVDCKNRTPPLTRNTEEAVGHAIGTPDILNGRILLNDGKRVNQETYDTWTQRAVPQAGDVVLTREAPVGRVGLVESNMKICLGQRTVLLRADRNRVNPRYLTYLLMGPQVQHELHSRASGSTVSHLRVAQVRELPLPEVPPLCEQQAIAEVLGSLDAKIAANERIAETTLALAEALYVRDSANENGWHEAALADTAKWMSGGTPNTSEPDYWDGDIPWISAASLKSPWLDDSERKITGLGAENGTKLVAADTIVFVVRGMSLTSEFRVGLTQREVAFGQDCKALVPHPGIDSVTLLLALRSRTREILGLVDTAGHGTGRLGTDRIEKLRVRLPNGDAAGAAFTETVRSLARHASAAQRETRTIIELRGTLLPQLVTGKIRVKDAVRVVEDVAS
ncbi:restriction endonuclease subunit S [Streptomyces sp. NBC_01754]|uniref:restriction endonuclease subunit S n=1 Tax=Streptomyces sp. NBC_01754 TaxID=2975930 RepID=UPI002DDAEB2D|nr:restriction endonuclease subunit S [Streptomyces sp. NBC_01754]WSC94024.1 restriction endonuclease subunit S [Streptomyces sp. NBC_01754]